MTRYTHGSCTAAVYGGLTILDNGCVRFALAVSNGALIPVAFGCVGHTEGLACDNDVLDAAAMSTDVCVFSAFQTDTTFSGRAKPHLALNIVTETKTFEVSMYDDIPFVSVRVFTSTVGDADAEITHIPVKPDDCVTAVSLYDCTDRNYTLVTEKTMTCGDEAEANIFLIKNSTGRELMLVKDAPTPWSQISHTSDASLSDGVLTLRGTGEDGTCDGKHQLYGYSFGIADAAQGGVISQFKHLMRAVNRCADGLFVMSNNWGDRSRDEKLCEEFVMREIDRAAEIGVDIVQLDAGWYRGAPTLGSADCEVGYLEAAENFWDVNPDRFPRGLRVCSDYAASKGVKLGLWYSPDAYDNYAGWERDAEIILGLREELNLAYFKLDGVLLDNKLSETRFLALLSRLYARTGGDIGINLDITADKRLGYLYERQNGTLFVENRYTDWKNYYPHKTLNAIWSLSRYLPTERFQFELLNNDRNREKYGDDRTAPANYSIEYEFASVMFANPLVWMEMQNLSDEKTARLADFIALWKRHRDALREAEIRPMFAEPDGYSLTGLCADCGDVKYYALFRELTDDGEDTFALDVCGNAELLRSDCADVSVYEKDGRLCVTVPEKQRFAFIRVVMPK